jgi:hypothetical protein
VAAALRALERGDPLTVPGLSNRLLVGLARLVPRRFQLIVTERLLRPAGTHSSNVRNGQPS